MALSSPWRHPAFSGWMWVVSCLPALAFPGSTFPHLHILYAPSCKTAHPFPPSTKAARASLWKGQPESQSVYAEPNEFDTMQINSASIWFECFQSLGVGGQSGLFALGTFCIKPFPQPLVWLVVTLQLPLPHAKQPKPLLLISFWPLEKDPRLWWLIRLVTAPVGILQFFLRWEEMALFRLFEECLEGFRQSASKLSEGKDKTSWQELSGLRKFQK